MTGAVRRILRGWRALAGRAGFVLALVGGSAALAALIALPLWWAATAHPRTYSIVAVVLLVGGGTAAAVRAAVRARRLPRDPSRGHRPGLAVPLGILAAVALACGLYGVVLAFFRGWWAIAAPAAVIWLIVAGWVGFGGRWGKAR